jgi:LPXTG-motif cell wall-anchored protein
MQSPGLPLRDIHQPSPPPWWPPAPGWWVLLAIGLAVAALAGWWWLRRRRRNRDVARLFDEQVRAAPTAVARIAAMSELLRRAARRRDPAADRLQGDAWLRFLDGDAPRAATAEGEFSLGPGRVLLDGGFRRAIADEDVVALLPLARRRYLELMAVRR